MKSLYQDEIIKLEDKQLQLAYILGGIKTKDNNPNCIGYWNCDIRCSCIPVEDDKRFEKVIEFIARHNISNETFLRLVLTYLKGHFNSYKGDFGNLIPELDRAIMDYKFHHAMLETKENDLKEKELIALIEKESDIKGTKLNDFLTKYSLTPVDFMILAKTSLNYFYRVGNGFEVKDLPVDLKAILKENDLYQSYEYVQKYREDFEKSMSSYDTLNANKSMSLIKKLRSKFKR